MIIKAYSKAKYSTWIYYAPLSILFDAGEGINCFMEEKLVSITDIVLTHGHTDHYTGLVNILMTKLAHYQNSGVVFPTRIYYPALDRTLARHIQYVREAYAVENRSFAPPVDFIPVRAGDRIPLDARKRTALEVFGVDHTKDVHAVGYRVVETRTKLRDEYMELDQREIQKVIAREGKENVTYDREQRLIVYTGDCKPVSQEETDGAEILLHECTFLKPMDRKGQLHSTIDEVLRRFAGRGHRLLLLFHFSSRYTPEQIAARIAASRIERGDTEIDFIAPGRIYQVD